jgi:hypothetical protein
MKILLTVLKAVLLWILLPLVLGITFVVAPCYTFGQHWPSIWCGYKDAPPHWIAQFWTGAAAALLIAFFVQRKTILRLISEGEPDQKR